MITSLFVSRNTKLLYNWNTIISKEKAHQSLDPSSVPHNEKITSFWVCGSVYINCMVLHYAIMCKFFNRSRPSPVARLQLSGRAASIKQPVGGDRRCTCTQRNPDPTRRFHCTLQHLPTCRNVHYNSFICLKITGCQKQLLLKWD